MLLFANAPGDRIAAADAAADATDGSDESRADAASLVRSVANAYAVATHGTIGVRSRSLLRIDAPLFHRRIPADTWFVFVDGALVRSSVAPDSRQPPLHDPYVERYLDEYRFSFAPCPACAEGTVGVAYESAVHDVAHASGLLEIDLRESRIVRDTERPYSLPWPTRDGSLEATWGDVGAGWFPKTISGDFVGRIGPFVGHAHYEQTLSEYARFPDVEAAATALDSNGRSSPARS